MSNIVLDNGQSIVTKSSNGRKGIPVDARTQVQYYKDIQNIEYAYENLQVIVTDDDPTDSQHPKGIYVITKLDSNDDVDPSGIKSLKQTVNVTKQDVGLENVDNVKQVPQTRTINNKPLSSNVTLDADDVGAIPTTEKGANGGVAELDSNRKLKSTQLPELTKNSVGLSNVDNTSDANKPISIATQTALNAKVDKISNAEGNLPKINSSGNLENSGFSIPTTENSDQILGYDSTLPGKLKWINKPVNGQNGDSAYQIWLNNNQHQSTDPGYSETDFLNSLKAHIGKFQYENTDSDVVSNVTNIGDAVSSINTLIPGDGNNGTNNTLDVIVLMNNGDTTTPKTMMFSTSGDSTNGYKFYYVGDLQSAMSNNVVTTDKIENDFAGGSGNVAGAEEVKTLKNKAIFAEETVENGVYLCDPDGNAIMRLDILDANIIGDKLSNIIIDLIKNNPPDDLLSDVFEDGFFICDENGYVIAKYISGGWVFYNNKKHGFYRKTGNLSNGDRLVLTSNSVKNNKRLVFSGTIDSFSTLKIGHGISGQWNASWVEINSSSITVYNWNGSQTNTSYNHGLTIQHNIQVEIVKNTGSNATLKIISDGEVFSQEITWAGDNGEIYVTGTSTLTNCSFSWTCSKLIDGIWIFGDSFISVDAPSRWTYYLIEEGFLNCLLNGHSGEHAEHNLVELKNLLEVATPKTIMWLSNGNNIDPFEGETPDPETDTTIEAHWMSAFREVEYICKQNDIELVLCTFPTSDATVATEGHVGTFDYQEPKNNFVRSSGYRYIDFDAAVGGDITGSWWPGMKSPNDVHPTVKGAKSLYQRAITDAPELMQ